MKLKELTAFLESVAPLAYQEDYDNSGLIVGDPDSEIKSAIISLDCTENVIEEAIRTGADLVISHHPIVFKGLKKFNGNHYVDRTIIKAIRYGIAIYAIHTNLDNSLEGVNKRICDKLGVQDCKILRNKKSALKKLVTFCPDSHAAAVRSAIFAAGAGCIGNYSECSYNTDGTGTFKAFEGANPFLGKIGERHQESEVRIEIIFPFNLEGEVIRQMKDAHPYEEVAYDVYSLDNPYQMAGSGMYGELKNSLTEEEFLQVLQQEFRTKIIRHTELLGKTISKVAVCGGAGSFLLNDAKAVGADIFISSDFKYHEFFEADKIIVIADIGHFESEQFTQELLLEIITKKFPNFALRLTEQITNPINYFI